MSTEITVAMVGVIGIILGAIVTHLLTRRKTDAEIEKIRAETEKARVESDKLRAEIKQLTSPINMQNENQKPDKEIAPHDVLTNISVTNSNEYKEHPSPDEIESALDNLPEYQKETALEGYKGIKIKWHLSLLTLTVKGNRAQVSLTSQLIKSVISCDVNIREYPELKLLKVNHGLWISGKILEIRRLGGYIIQLSDCKLDID